jgi:hypothetical protein
MAVAEGMMSDASSALSDISLPSISAFQDGIPGADSLKQIASDVSPSLQNAAKSFAPVAQNLSQQMKTLTESGEMKRMTDSLNKLSGDVFSNGVRVG